MDVLDYDNIQSNLRNKYVQTLVTQADKARLPLNLCCTFKSRLGWLSKNVSCECHLKHNIAVRQCYALPGFNYQVQQRVND